MLLLRNAARGLSRLAASGRELGVYAALVLLIPGGSLIALGVWAFRHRSSLQPKPLRP